MQVIPAIDIMGKKCVRLSRGDFSQATVFSSRPADAAREFVSQGAQLVHVVDLDGAKSGKLANFDILDQLSYICKMQIGGGIRDMAGVKKILSLAAMPILSTAALDEKFLKTLAPLKSKIAIAIDVRDGKLATNGWLEQTGVDAYDFAKASSKYCSRIIFTSISQDGTMAGPDIGALREMRKAVKAQLIASGGISSLEDVLEVKKAGADGCIIGKALYLGKIDLKEAIEAAR